MRTLFLSVLLLFTISVLAQKPELVTPVGHTSTVTAVGITFDGKYLVSGGWDSKLIIWEKTTGKKIASVVLPDQVIHLKTGRSNYVAGVALQNGTFATVDISKGKIIRVFPAYTTLVRSIDFSSNDSKIVVTAENKIDVWENSNSGRAKTYRYYAERAVSAYYTLNENILAAGDSTLKLIDAQSDTLMGAIRLDTCRISHMWVDQKINTWVTVNENTAIRIWKLKDGEYKNTLTATGANVGNDCYINLSSDGSYLMAKFNFDDSLNIYDLNNGKKIGSYETSFLPDLNIQHNEENATFQNPFCFTNDSYTQFTGVGTNKDLYVRDTSGKIVTEFTGNSTSINDLFISKDDKQILFYSFNDNIVKNWDLKNNTLQTVFNYLDILDRSADGKTMVTEGDSSRFEVYDFETRRLLRKVPILTEGVDEGVLSPDARYIYTGYFGPDASKHDLTDGRILTTYKSSEETMGSIKLSPDGKILATGFTGGKLIVWEEATAKILYEWSAHKYTPENLLFTSDSRYLVSGGASSWMHCRSDQALIVWDLQTGKEVRRISTGGTCMRKIILSPDEKKLIGASDLGGQLYIWDFATGKLERIVEAHSSFISAVAYTNNGKFLVSGSIDNSIAFWDPATWTLKTRLVPFGSNDWLSATPEGLFDASPDVMKQMYFVVSDSTDAYDPWKVIDFNQLKQRYYQPGLLPILTGHSTESLREVPNLERLEMAPLVEPRYDKKRLYITVSNKGGGIGKVNVFLNNAEIIEDAIAYSRRQVKGDSIQLAIDLQAFAKLINDGEENVLKVQAFNKDNWLSSRPDIVRFTPPAATKGGQVSAVNKEKKVVKPHFYALVCGTSDYSGSSIDLKYAAKDAQDIANALRLSASKMFGAANVHITLLNSEASEDTRKPVKKNFLRAMKALDSSRKEDVFLVYLSGHGVNYGGQDGDFYYLFAQAAGSDAAYLNDPVVRSEMTLSSNELTQLFNQKKAGKKILLLDACASGKAAENMAFAMRDVPASQVRALDRMADRTGFYVLSGSAADAVSYETSVYGQGLLTYSLLKAIRGAALRSDGGEEYVDVQKLLQFTVDDVPVLAKGIGGIQQPLYRSPGDQKSFDIGMVDAAIKNQIVLSEPKPVFVASSFINEARKRDDLKVSDLINAQLQEITAKGKTAELLFIEAKDYPNAWELSGTYKIEGDTITADCLLFKNEQEKTFSVKGAKANLPGLVQSILAEVKKLIR